MLILKDFLEGDRVAMHPTSTVGLRGFRRGRVLRRGRKFLSVRTDHGKVVLVLPRDIAEIITKVDA